MARTAVFAVLTLTCAACAQRTVQATIPRAETASSPRRFVSPHSYAWFTRAELHLARGELTRARDAYRMALSGAEEDPYVMARLADLLDRLGSGGEAKQLLDAAAAIDIASEAVWLTRGHIAARHGAMKEAVEAYERAEVAAPLSATGPLALARLLRTQGHPERANAVLARFASRNALGSVNSARADFELALARDDGTQAALAVSRWLRVAPASARVVQDTAARLSREGHPTAAAKLLEPLPLETTDPALRLEIMLAAEDRDGAESILISAAPEALGGRIAIAAAYLRLGQPLRALDLAADQSDPRDRVIAAEALLDLGRFAEAAHVAGSVPRAAPGFERARLVIRRAAEAAALGALASEIAGATSIVGRP